MQFPWQHWIFQHSSPEIRACFLTTPLWLRFPKPLSSFIFNFLSKNRAVMNYLRFLHEEEVVY